MLDLKECDWKIENGNKKKDIKRMMKVMEQNKIRKVIKTKYNKWVGKKTKCNVNVKLEGKVLRKWRKIQYPYEKTIWWNHRYIMLFKHLPLGNIVRQLNPVHTFLVK
jgi:hypothetical protein